MKTLDDIWQEHINHESLTPKTMQDLVWHIENDVDPLDAITMATDMDLKELSPYIARHLDHTDEYVRELAVGCLVGRLQLAEYAQKGFKMAKEDPEENVRDLAIFSIGAVLNRIKDKNLQHEIAYYLYQKLIDQDESFKGAAYKSILEAMEIPISTQPRVRDLENMIDFSLVERFKKKYGI